MSAGSVYRVVRSQDYVTISNYHLRDKRLTMAAKGLMSVLLTDEGEAAYTIGDLAGLGPEGRDAVRSALKRLEEAGYIRKRQRHDGAGRFSANEYLIYESPLTGKPLTENPTTVEPLTGKPLTENPTTVGPAPELELNQGFDIPPQDESVSPLRENKVENPNPPASPPGRTGPGPKWKPERFRAFWDFYRTNCRGESKQAAIRAWDRLRPDDGLLETIGKALRRQLRTEEWRRGIGIPYASTYLNQRRWEDAAGPLRDHEGRGSSIQESEYVTDWTPGVIP